MKARVRDKQNIFNIALQQYGSIEGLFDILKNNAVSLNSILSAGTELEINPALIVNPKIVEEYSKVNYVPNTGDKFSTELGEFDDDFNDDFNI